MSNITTKPQQNETVKSAVEAVIFDWAGTIVDFGSFAPTTIFVEAFKTEYDFDISLAEARVPMGLGKWDHIQAVGKLDSVAQRWLAQFGKAMQIKDIDQIYNRFIPLQKAKVAEHAQPILNAVNVVNDLKEQGIKIGSCSGYPRVVMDILIPAAAEFGYQPDCIVASDDLQQGGRPGPYMALQNVIELAVSNVANCIKVDDSTPGIDEGNNAGMWTVGLLLSGNEAGLTAQQYHDACPQTLANARDKARLVMQKSKPNFLIDTINDLPAVVTEIERRLSLGEHP